MPIAYHPNQTIDFTLKVDESLPVESRPVFLIRHVSSGEHVERQQLLRNAAAETDAAAINELLNKALVISLAGWRNMKDPFTPASFDKVFTPAEKEELVLACITKPGLNEEDRKKFASAPS